MSKFSRIRSSRIDFGKTMSPRSRCQRRVTCEGVLPWAAATSPMTGSPSTLPWAIGDQASTSTPWRIEAARASSLVK
jgi:hypothetical protein